MDGIHRRTWLRGALALLASGCSAFAVRPPTPAARLDGASLNHADPGEHFYCLIFASQSVPKRPSLSHTWMTVVRAVERPGGCPEVLDVHTISWLPATLNIEPRRHWVEPAVNLTLHQTIMHVRSNRERVSLWGPYECRPSLYRRFLIQKEFLESGQIGYQCDDNLGEAARTGNGCCCIHAISDMDPNQGRANYPLIWFGDAASEHLVNHYHERGSFLDPEVQHDWLLAALELDGYPLVRRRYRDRLLDFPRIQPGRILGGRTNKTTGAD